MFVVIYLLGIFFEVLLPIRLNKFHGFDTASSLGMIFIWHSSLLNLRSVHISLPLKRGYKHFNVEAELVLQSTLFTPKKL